MIDKEGINIGKPSIEIRHSDLKLASEHSMFRAVCPVCGDGILFVKRECDTSLSNKDNCCLCGQSFVYTDINKMREDDPLSKRQRS